MSIISEFILISAKNAEVAEMDNKSFKGQTVFEENPRCNQSRIFEEILDVINQEYLYLTFIYLSCIIVKRKKGTDQTRFPHLIMHYFN